MLKKFFRIFVPAVYSGLCIGIGGMVYLNCENKVVGAFMFCIGLLTILLFGFNLYTGKVGYICQNKPAYIGQVAIVWLGNFAGTAVMAGLCRLTRNADKLTQACQGMVETKLNDSLLSLFVLAIFCGMLMFIAVDTYKHHYEKKDTMVTVVAILGVVVFILAGFEHCIADMFYFTLAGAFPKAFPALIVMTLGNAVGGNIIPLGQNIMKKLNS